MRKSKKKVKNGQKGPEMINFGLNRKQREYSLYYYYY